ncbi:hypothetical protein H6G32_08230 [Cylindrospermum sp. FACHB-282]|nr:hypothetical protein [Cylindrospermum sp. FACHB-282]
MGSCAAKRSLTNLSPSALACAASHGKNSKFSRPTVLLFGRLSLSILRNLAEVLLFVFLFVSLHETKNIYVQNI